MKKQKRKPKAKKLKAKKSPFKFKKKRKVLQPSFSPTSILPPPKKYKLPPIHFWSAYIQKDGLPLVYIGMTDSTSKTMARQRILKEWYSQPHVIEEIQSGKATLVLRRLGLKKVDTRCATKF